MQDCQHIHVLRLYQVNHDVGQAGNNQFSCAFHTSCSAGVGKVGKASDSLADALAYLSGGCWSLLCDVGANLGKMGKRGRRVADNHPKAAKAALTSASVANSPAFA